MWNKIKIFAKLAWGNFKYQAKMLFTKYSIIMVALTATGWLVKPRYDEYKEKERVEERRLDSLDLNRRFDMVFDHIDKKLDSINVQMTFDTSSAEYSVLLRDMKIAFKDAWSTAPVYINRYLDEEKLWMLSQEVKVTDEKGKFLHYEYYVRITPPNVKPEIWQKIHSTESKK